MSEASGGKRAGHRARATYLAATAVRAPNFRNSAKVAEYASAESGYAG